MGKVSRIFFIVFGGIGLACLCVAAYFFQDTQRFLAGAATAQGTVVEVEEGRTFVVQFQVGERKLRITHGRRRWSNPSRRVGDSMPVLYRPENPDDARIDSFAELWLLPVILGGQGALFFLVGGIVGIVGLVGARRRARARTLGVAVQANVSGILERTQIRMNGRHPWVMTATYDDGDGKKLTFTSDHIWKDPRPFYPEGSTVTVYYLPSEPGVHDFDLDKMSAG